MVPHILLVLLGGMCKVAADMKIPGIYQDSGVKTAIIGGDVTLHCSFKNDAVNFISWYQQSLGGKPVIIATRMKLNAQATISPAYKERFQVDVGVEDGINHLIIKGIRLSDSATYYCGILEFNAIEFGKGVFLHVKTSSSNTQAVVHQPALEPLRVGDSVNLSCTVHAEQCAEEQTFYWFRHGAAQPSIMYHSAGQCKFDSESQVRNCTLNLPIKAASSSDAGMYYCALASCGEVVFGSGTRVEVRGGSAKVPSLLVSCLSVVLAGSIIMLLTLAVIIYKLNKKSCSLCEGTDRHLTVSAASDTTGQDVDILHYAALSLNRTSERHRQEESTETHCVYSRVKSRKV
ncbi:uncharacterized protein LOC132958622 [Labrus mixtus]|uniref:uncharacterized protein LOC132958622 n=1 Tax=Labrus mixtus TaxID=508554 RepID=UPI0029BFFBD5|nr:uncharacterized protein LOC132958622 [Labrus mixtus]